MRILGINNVVNFQRKPTKLEEPELQATVNKAYDLIGVKERAVITHGSCFPSVERDTYIGSPYGESAREYIKFLALYGFNGNQLGPGGLLETDVNSPYKSSAFAQNRLFIDLKELTTDKYGNILSRSTYEGVTSEPRINNKNYSLTDFKKSKRVYDIALKEAYNNFKTGLKTQQPELIKLRVEYGQFLKRHNQRLLEEGIFQVLAKENGTDDYTTWLNQKDARLITDLRKGDVLADERFSEIYHSNVDEINQYKFEQFIATKQIKEHQVWRQERGFDYINDLLVGCSKMDAWRYEDAFLDDWEMGAFEGNGISQRWHIPVIDPKKIFANGDYDLNIGGEFLKEKISFALEFCENLRVDHVMGLVEPYLMSKNAHDSDFITNPTYVKNKDIEKYISELKDPQNANQEYDLYWDYPKLIEKLVLPTFREYGLDKNSAVWEDICSWPDRFKQVYAEQQLPKITNLDWAKASDMVKYEPENWFILGSHDNIPAMNYLKRTAKLNNGEVVEYTRKQQPWNGRYLAEYLNQDDTRANIVEIRKTLEDLYNKDDKAIVRAKFTELMTTPKFQISFDDLLGITEVVYNVPGQNLESNWKARISPDFIDKYYENLSSGDSTALNIPELLHDALQAKIDIQVREHNYDQDFKSQIYAEAQPVLDKLAHFAEVLKEK